MNDMPRPTKQDAIDALAALDCNGDGVISFDGTPRPNPVA